MCKWPRGKGEEGEGLAGMEVMLAVDDAEFSTKTHQTPVANMRVAPNGLKVLVNKVLFVRVHVPQENPPRGPRLHMI